ATTPEAKPAKAKKEKAIKLPKQPKAPKERDPRLPAVGETILKEWRGRRLEVKCLPGGFEFEGKTEKSLSRIASTLQGCPSNGFLFFGLTPAAKEAAARRAEREAAKAAEALNKELVAGESKPEKKEKGSKQAKAKKGKVKGAKKQTAKSK